MGLFDRFRRKVKETPPDEALLAEPDSEEAQEAISEKLELTRKEDTSLSKQRKPPSKQPEDDEWDDDEPESAAEVLWW